VTSSAPKSNGLDPKKPSYAGLPTHDLHKQLSSFGFKPVKKREKMIELLEKCWEEKHGKQDTSIGDDSVQKHGDFLSKVHDISNRPQPKEKKPRKRAKDENGEISPRKVPKSQKKTTTASEGTPVPKTARKRKTKASTLSEAKVIDVDEVDSPITIPPKLAEGGFERSVRQPTPPPSMPAQALRGLVDTTEEARMGPLKPQSIILTADATPPLSGTDIIGEKIQAAIMRQSEDAASEDRDHLRDPTWHEKILLFDPIILEDLTAWLNMEGLGRVDEDREVSALDVRDWCESNSICCLWRGGWRGQKLRGGAD
jgi:Slx4 endonuclease